MVRDTVTHSLDKNRLPAVLKGQLSGFFGNFPHGKDIVAIYTDGVYSITDTSTSNSIASILL